MLQRGFYYAAGTVMICAIGAASLQLAMQILSFSSPLADAAAALATAAILANSLHRRMRAAAKHRPARSTSMPSGDVAAITAGPVLRERVQHRRKAVARPARCRLEPRRGTAGCRIPLRDGRGDPAGVAVCRGQAPRSVREKKMPSRTGSLVGSGRNAA
jgi:hypothetical protein